MPAEDAARAAALKQCKGDCTAVTMKRACAALAIDLKNPCGPHGYAVFLPAFVLNRPSGPSQGEGGRCAT